MSNSSFLYQQNDELLIETPPFSMKTSATAINTVFALGGVLLHHSPLHPTLHSP